MTGCGAPGGPGIIRCLMASGEMDLHVADSNPFASGRFLAPKFIQVPKADSLNFVEFVLDYCVANAIEVVFPLVTRELFEFSKSKKRFEEVGVRVVVSDYDSLCIVNDKGKLYQSLKNKKIELPDFELINNYEEFEWAKNRFLSKHQSFVVKPTIGNGSRGVRIVDSNVNEYDLLFNEKPNSLYIGLSKLSDILRSHDFPPLLISELLPGEEFTIDTIVSNQGVPVLILPRRRNTTNGGISISGTFIYNEEIIEYCRSIITSFELKGPIGLQVKRASNGSFKLLEINPRIQGTSVAAIGLGINLPLLSLSLLFDEEIYIPPIKWGTSFTRYYEEVFF